MLLGAAWLVSPPIQFQWDSGGPSLAWRPCNEDRALQLDRQEHSLAGSCKSGSCATMTAFWP
ncbi:hypothetical protein VC83_05306 [Pseudogymnoascus destructans]|uniref:Uncharacterized protein n=1 Tax=Pseudogymnoascus destructans TaxID=655981 RepID=A0A177A764_9PEZI|nr:uncharacterized protein VC83_05306 [Pseudogymnoascus destructans]OAF57998.1 hypothetical protein VC83_05306 [Pseudogymnoascus destructans]